ncbi:DUF6714 family protein [Thiofilum flexile]|uniref:DUF6714 family protein n=1 Tax=Thiofilum flexile TaxID=125627 RepID=UPI00035D507D|nr:DUF6714 family protein [Thiofilum flexile]
MQSAESLSLSIQDEFSDVPFPSHCGLHAAVAIDDWIEDEEVLKEITEREDYIGEWKNVPIEHLLQCMTALCYLDARGMAFYLPAYMKAIIEEPTAFDKPRCSSAWQVIWTMCPCDDDPELKQYFLDQFTLIHGGKKRVCRKFLEYVATCSAYHEEAREIAQKALAHDFWAIESH